ncbi:MAG: FAD-dependent monooxygenase [Mycobacteriaceae bacterium]|nr:FAD-dependent monooxygenase [Mycobacteriaceae bacterium]
MPTVLVSGASVAGTALAYWLERQGFTVTVVERCSGLRPGGQAIDVRGPALTVLDRMGLLSAARTAKTGIRGMSAVDAQGNEVQRNDEVTATGGIIATPDIELLRDDLVALMYAASTEVEYLFDDTITAMDESVDSVLVTFEHGVDRVFDLVIGADGLHSTVRRLVFGPEARFARRMGKFLAVCTAPNFLDLDHWQLWYNDDNARQFAGVYSARGNAECRIMFGFTDETLNLDYRDVALQRNEIERRFSETGRFTEQLLRAMRDASDFYCDEMSQIVMDRWSGGRVGLVGDAAHCASPMSGQGTSLALIGAYVLAEELALAGGNQRSGFLQYEARLRQYVLDTQELAFADSSDDEAWWNRFYSVINSFTLT